MRRRENRPLKRRAALKLNSHQLDRNEPKVKRIRSTRLWIRRTIAATVIRVVILNGWPSKMLRRLNRNGSSLIESFFFIFAIFTLNLWFFSVTTADKSTATDSPAHVQKTDGDSSPTRTKKTSTTVDQMTQAQQSSINESKQTNVKHFAFSFFTRLKQILADFL